MRCRQVIDKISEYIDGELDPELVRELSATCSIVRTAAS